MQWAPVPTTCTASQLTGWSLNALAEGDELRRSRYALEQVKGLINLGFYRDYALLTATLTDKQNSIENMNWFITSIGFQEVFVGDKEDNGQRNKHTGAIHLYASKPRDYEASLKKFQKALEDRINVLDRRRIDPERQAQPDLKLYLMKKAGLIKQNAYADNPIHQIMTDGTDADAVAFFIRQKFGMDVTEVFKGRWPKVSTNQLKEAHAKWKVELVPY